MPQFDEWSKLLRPIARDSATDCENAKSLLPQQGGSKMLQIFKRVEADLVATRAFAHAVVQGNVQSQLGVRESRHKYWHAFLICRFQNPALFLRTLRQELANGVVQLVGAHHFGV